MSGKCWTVELGIHRVPHFVGVVMGGIHHHLRKSIHELTVVAIHPDKLYPAWSGTQEIVDGTAMNVHEVTCGCLRTCVCSAVGLPVVGRCLVGFRPIDRNVSNRGTTAYGGGVKRQK